MKTIATNFITLHGEEERLRGLAIQAIENTPDLLVHLEITHRAMDVLDMLRKHFTANSDELAISHLGIRVFNAFASAIKLSLSGYYQAGVMVMRDVIETSELVELFQLDMQQLERWKVADQATLIREFTPGKVRKELDKAAGKGKSRREEIYKKFSHYAAHPSVDGFAMLRPKGMDSRCGPFPDITALRAVLEEMGELAVRAGFAFAIFLDSSIGECNAVNHKFLRTAMDFAERYHGKIYTDQDRLEVDRLFGDTPQ
ncbi:hypothetical protein [Stenotrophomonas sp. TWI819]|uniref:hypothetical protein n=1 Tax=Stenotrophomonas sp. TWI819 TaxID=3136800 RepID=UPI003208109A